MPKIRVMIVDDSATVRQVLSAVLAEQPDMEVIATASDPIFALEKMKSIWPDVLLLDIEMPRMDGLTFLRQLMKERPLPVVICSTLTEKGTQVAIQALAAGAVSVAAKPTTGLKAFLEQQSDGLVLQIRAAASVRLKRATKSALITSSEHSNSITKNVNSVSSVQLSKRPAFIAIGASTGGPQAIEHLLTALPSTMPGILIVQHMPPNFTAAFAQRLNKICQLEVKEAQSGDVLRPGLVLIAPGAKHMQVRLIRQQFLVDVQAGPYVNRHCPSVDVLFKSVAETAGEAALGVILTGMGNDGARGLREMYGKGALTIAQDEASSVVYGMPKEAVKMGGVSHSLSLDAISACLQQCALVAH